MAVDLEEELARATAAAGVLGGMSAAAWRHAEDEPLDDALRAEPISWKSRFVRLRRGSATVRELAARWEAAARRAHERGAVIRLRFDGVASNRRDRQVQLVLTRVPELDGAYFPLRRRAAQRTSWSRPPRVGVHDPRLRDALTAAGHHAEMVTERGTDEYDLIVVSADTGVAELSATFVLVLHQPGEDVNRLAVRLAAEARSGGWITAAIAEPRDSVFLARFLDAAREAPLDVALRRAAAASDLRGTQLAAERSALIRTDPEVPSEPEWSADKIESAPERERGDLPLEHVPGPYGEPERPVPGPPALHLPPRYLQGRVTEPGSGERVGVLSPGRRYDLLLHIGALDPTWAAADAPLPEMWPDDAVDHELTVVLTLPSLQEEPQVARLLLPAEKRTNDVRFSLDLPRARGVHHGRAIVLHGGRVLQTSRVTLYAGLPPTGAPGPLDLSVETAPRPGLDALDVRRPFGAAFVVNHRAGDEIPAAMAIQSDGVPMFLPQGWDSAAESLRTALQEVVEAERDPTDERDSQLAAAFNALAQHGDLLRSHIAEDLAFTGKALPPLQIVSTRPDSWLPLELVYDGPVPADEPVELCSRAFELLRAGTQGACDAEHAAEEVCPLGFWGLRTVIERQAYDPALREERWDWRVFSEPTPSRDRLTPPTAAVLAAHRNVDVIRKTATAAVLETLSRVGLPDARVYSWEKWCERLEQAHPSLLITLGHTSQASGSRLGVLEIEVGRLLVNLVAQKHVSNGRVNPVVLLLGCSTASVPVPFQGFAAAFRRAGAPVVVATVTEVLGRHSAAAAQAAIELFANRAGEDIDVGEAMLRLRRRLVADGMPIGLALLAFGDADWRLGIPDTAPHRGKP